MSKACDHARYLKITITICIMIKKLHHCLLLCRAIDFRFVICVFLSPVIPSSTKETSVSLVCLTIRVFHCGLYGYLEIIFFSVI